MIVQSFVSQSGDSGVIAQGVSPDMPRAVALPTRDGSVEGCP